MRNADYWRGRFKILEEAAHSEGDKSIDAIGKMYLEAQRTVLADIERWFGRFAENNEISLTDARKLLTSDELEEFQWTVDKYIEVGKTAGLSSEWQKKLENASAKFHVSRLEAIQTQIQQEIEKLFQNQQDEVNSLLKGIIEDGYTQTAYNIQKGIGVGWNITAIDEKKLNTLLTKPWTTDSRTFSDRIWLKKDELVANVQKELTQGLLRGDSQRKITDAIKNRFGVSQYQAGRLVHTETTYFNALSTQQAYKDLGVEEIEIVETLDSHTCDTCRAMDGKVIPLAQYEPGVTVPPFHPNCRGTTCPYFDDMDGERAARDADGNIYYVPEDMSYEKWHKTFAENGSKKGLTAVSKDDIIVSGAISGALNEYSDRAKKHAAQYYEAVRKMTTDCKRIAENTGYTEDEIKSIKDYIFNDVHDLGNGRIERFDPNYCMAESWQRLIDGKNIQEHDLTLLKHEIMEKRLMSEGYSQDEAHRITSRKYNYDKESREYYGKIKTHN